MAEYTVTDLAADVDSVILLAPQVATTTQTGTGTDASKYDGNAKVVVNVGAVSGTTPSCTVKIQDSADNSTFADVAGATTAALTTGSQIVTFALPMRARNKYLRAVATISGTTPSFAIGVAMEAAGASQLPLSKAN